MKLAVEQIKKTDKQVYSRMVAPSVLDSAAPKVPREAAEIVSSIGAFCQRLVRRLCDECKEGFEPPQLLKQLGIPAGRVAMLYRPLFLHRLNSKLMKMVDPHPLNPVKLATAVATSGELQFMNS